MAYPTPLCEIDDRFERELGALCLPVDARSVAVARRHVVDVARTWGVSDDVIEVAELLCSEIVTNAVVHSKRGSFIEVSVMRDGRGLVVECCDPSMQLPRVVTVSDPLRESRRGMYIVSTLAYDHGAHLMGHAGKVVWFELIAWPQEAWPQESEAAAGISWV
jgi:anti-sigma regulatory factor (Ser/Thr protein kinase)